MPVSDVAAPRRSAFAGPLHDLARGVLARHREAAAYRDGTLAQPAWRSFADRVAGELVAAGVPPGEVHFVKRYPRDPKPFVRDAVARLAAAGVLPHATWDEAAADDAASLAAAYDHDGYGTFIYPEEGLLLHALVTVLRPRATIFLGSYYGYWAAWALPALARCGGCAVLVDPDPSACAVARHNLAEYGELATVATATGAEFLGATRERFDLVVIDAELPRSHPDPDLAGKAVYRSLLQDALARCAPRTHVVCHNILFNDDTGDAHLARVIERNERELAGFRALAARELDRFVEIASTEGVGVGVRSR
jgi:predicted O-methyltransferase YrrM